jgi:multidrug efflux system membrane fusion protein
MTSKKKFVLAGSLAIVIGLVAVIAQGGLLAPAAKKQGANDKPVPVKAALAERRNASSHLKSIGTVQALNTVVVRARTDGEISRVFFEEGTRVKRGDMLVALDPRLIEVQLRSAQAQLAKDQAQFDNTKRDLERYEFLVKKESISLQTLDATRAQLEQMRATLSSDQAQIDLAQLQLDFTSIRAPIDGRLGARLVDAGNVVHASDANGIVIMSQIQPVFVTFSIPQNALDILRHQQSHRPLRVLAMNQDGSEVLDDGMLTLIESQIDTATGTVRCKATFKNASEKLWPGAFVSVEIVLNDLPDVVLVPTIAIQSGAQHPFVYVVTPKNVVETRQVEVGSASGDQTVILTGLAEGEHVVVEGQFQVGEGTRVDVKGALIAEPLGQSNEGHS